ncbi:MAG: DUF6285 domain-containing protein [Halioglobus sp.]
MNSTTPTELLDAVRQFLREQVLPELEGFKAYNTRVAANALGIVAREIELGTRLAAVDQAMAASLGLNEQAGTITRQIALGLRDGTLAVDEQMLVYLRRRTLLAVAIDNPKYSALAEARARWPQSVNLSHCVFCEFSTRCTSPGIYCPHAIFPGNSATQTAGGR